MSTDSFLTGRGCAKTSSCSLAWVSTLQQCITHSSEVSKTISSNIQPALEGLVFSASIESDVKFSVSNQTCASTSSTQTYQFTDQECHALCGQQKMLAVYGYKAQVCNYDFFRRKSHDHKVCMEDFVILFPSMSTSTRLEFLIDF